jgi:hypothetical protein
MVISAMGTAVIVGKMMCMDGSVSLETSGVNGGRRLRVLITHGRRPSFVPVDVLPYDRH